MYAYLTQVIGEVRERAVLEKEYTYIYISNL